MLSSKPSAASSKTRRSTCRQKSIRTKKNKAFYLGPARPPFHLGWLFGVDRLFRFFDQLFKPRIVANRIPPRVQTQLSVGDVARSFQRSTDSINRAVFLPGPRVNQRQISKEFRAGHDIF